MKPALILLLNFFKNPNEEQDSNQKLTYKFKWLFLLLLFDLVLVLLVLPLQKLPVTLGFLSTQEYKSLHFLSNIKKNPEIIFLFFVIIIPLIEELAFRLLLRIKKNYFIPFILYFICIGGISVIYLYSRQFSLIFLFPLFLALLAFYLLYHNSSSEKLKHLLKKHYKLYFYLMVFIFAFYHIQNYTLSWYVILFAPLLTLPQLILGLFCSFARLKFGVLWSILLHAIHNAIFIVPFIFITNETPPKLINKIDKENYKFEVHEGYAFNKENGILIDQHSSTSKITPNEIILYGTFNTIVSKLAHVNKNRIEFENKLLSEHTISLYFKTDTAFQQQNSMMSQRLALENLLKAYDLNMRFEQKKETVWNIEIYNEEVFKSHFTADTIQENRNTIRNFYGPNDTLKFQNINPSIFEKALKINFNVEARCKFNRTTQFSIEIPNNSRRSLNQFLKAKYGLSIKEEKNKGDFLIIK